MSAYFRNRGSGLEIGTKHLPHGLLSVPEFTIRLAWDHSAIPLRI